MESSLRPFLLGCALLVPVSAGACGQLASSGGMDGGDGLGHDAGRGPRDGAVDVRGGSTVDATKVFDARLPVDATLPIDTGVSDAGPPPDAARSIPDAGTAVDAGVDASGPADAARIVDAPFDSPRDGGVDAVTFLGPADAEWLVDAPVDAASCASIAAALCARIAACPVRAGFTQLCLRVEPETLCFDSYAGCVTLFEHCVPTTTPLASHLTFLPQPDACAAALDVDNCVVAGQDHNFNLPTSCGVCPPPWNGPDVCPLVLPDAGDGGP